MSLEPVSSGDPHVPAHNEEREAINNLEIAVNDRIKLPPGAATGDLLRWDGTNWMTTDTRFFEGNGSPNGAVAAPVGSRYIDKIAATGAVEWIKRFNGDSNTGWIEISGDSGWLEVGSAGNAAFTNTWKNYGSGWATAAYRKINGIVYLKGLVTRGAASRAAQIFVLPAGFRPAGNMHIAALNSGNVSSDLNGVNITAGTGGVTGRPTTGGYTALDGICFPADN